MTRLSPALVACLSLAASVAAAEPTPPVSEGTAAFLRLKTLAGEWQGSVGKPGGPASRVLYRVTANGHTLMETLFPGTDHEMISMYHLDAGDLVLTHYCAVGNQPRMRLNPEKSSKSELVFDFNGGSNLDPAKDGHIHAGRIRLLEPDRIEAEWTFYAGGQPAGTNSFFLSRKPD